MTRLTVFADALLHDGVATARIVFRLFHLLNDFSDFAAAHLFLHILSLSPQTLAIWNLMHFRSSIRARVEPPSWLTHYSQRITNNAPVTSTNDLRCGECDPLVLNTF